MKWHSPHRKNRKKKKVVRNNVHSSQAKFQNNCKRVQKKRENKDEKFDTLYIIGNGFDLHHGIKTNYMDFREYLKSQYIELFEELSQYYRIDKDSKLWSNFEKGLKDFDYTELVMSFGDYLPNYASDEFYERDRYVLELYVKNKLDSLRHELQEAFNNWINDLKMPSNLCDEKIKLDNSACFLNFNYTGILETYYNVPRKNITYIHNKSGEGKNLLYGHAWNPYYWAAQRNEKMPKNLTEEARILWKEKQADKYDYSEERAYIAIDNFFSKIYKNCKVIISNNEQFFSKIKGVQKIYILGHSMSEVDLPYFKKIIKSIKFKKVNWIVSSYNDDFTYKRKILINLGVNSQKINSISLSYLKRYKQLSLFNNE